ncbi:glutathione S-transferase-like [Homalodisca vitripennis]|uniref:glutathione S-transferase-like n=1 Tax=Homalodisca vitripennis TaxID=197043 RepID=UPI001EEC493D|nr:glutathione S-transferase-like [Homalodisca vitripennis]
MALKPKFTYFNCIGLGEPIRFLFAYLDRDYDDNRFEDDVWDKLKPTTPWGKVPVLEVEGQKPVVQSIAIARYLAKEAGLTGNDPWEDLRIDEIVYVINDLRAELAKYQYEENKTKKQELEGPLFDTTVPFYMSRIEAHAKSNDGFLANGKLSWADIYFAAISDYLSHMNRQKDILEGCPTLKALKEKVFSLPKIKAYVAKRPITDELKH